MNKEQEKKFFELICVCNNQQQELERYKNIVDELEKLCNEEIKNSIKITFGDETSGLFIKQTLTSYEFILYKLKELKGSDN